MLNFLATRSRLFFPKNWMGLSYAILGCCVISLAATPSYSKPIIIAAVAAFALFLFAFSIHKVSFGFYVTIAFSFLMSFIDRMTGFRFPLYTIIFLAPFALFVFIIIRGIFYHERFKIEGHLLVYGYFFIFAYGILQFFNPEMGSTLGWLIFFRQLLSNTALLLVSLHLFRSLKSIRFYFRFLMTALFITALYGCYQQWIGLNSFELRWLYSRPGALALLSLPGGGIRKFSFFSDPANFGTLMAAGSVGTLILSIESRSKRRQLLLGAGTLIILLGMSYSGTRTASIMVAAGLLLHILLTLYQKKTQILAAGAAIIFLFIMNVPIYSNVTINRFRSAFQAPKEDASFDTRLMNRQKIRPYLHQHPFGGGVGTTGESGRKYNPHHFLASIPPDSSLVASYMSIGWVGLATHLGFLFLILVYAVHYYYRCQNREIKTYYAIIANMLFTLGLVGAYAQYTLGNMPQTFVYIPFIAITIQLHNFDTPALSQITPKTDYL